MRLQRELESCVQMRLYSMNRCHILLIFLGTLTAFTIALIMGLHGPSVLQHYSVLATKLHGAPSDFRTGPFHIQPPPLSVFHQELWLSAVVRRMELNQNTGLFLTFNVSVDVSVSNQMARDSPDDQKNFVSLRSSSPRTVTLYCLHAVCDELFLAHVVPIDFTTYRFTVRFDGLTPQSQAADSTAPDGVADRLIEVLDIAFVFQFYNPQFTYMELISRFVFFILTELITVLFLGSLRHFALRDWTIEQRCTALLLFPLLFYNNPFYPIRFLTNSWFPQFMDYLFQVTFQCAVLLFWLVVYHGLRVVKRTVCAFYLPKIMVVLAIWFTFVGLCLWKTYYEYTSTSFNATTALTGALYIEAFLVLFGLIYLVFLIVLMIRAYAELRKLPYFNLRLQVLTMLSVLTVTTSLASLVLRFGAGLVFNKQPLHPVNLITAEQKLRLPAAEQKQPEYISTSSGDRSALEFTLIYTMWNSYLMALALIYSPSQDANRDAYFKDDPSVSMINDSDEEVIYDSDAESTQLTNRMRT